MSIKVPCPSCDVVHSTGSMKLTKYGTVDDYVEGEFTADMWYSTGYNPPRKSISGKFRVRRK